jgi:hypothetical protein
MLPDHAPTLPHHLQFMQQALRSAKAATQASRERNKKRIDAKARTNQVEPGDHVTLRVNEPIPLTSKRDPLWMVTRVRGPIVFIKHQRTGASKVVNKEKVKVVDPDIAWDVVNPRPKRDRRPPAVKRREHQQCERQLEEPAAEVEPAAEEEARVEAPEPMQEDATPPPAPERPERPWTPPPPQERPWTPPPPQEQLDPATPPRSETRNAEDTADMLPRVAKRSAATHREGEAEQRKKQPRHGYNFRKRKRSQSPADDRQTKKPQWDCLGLLGTYF